MQGLHTTSCISQLQHGLSACTVDNLTAKARELSLCTGALLEITGVRACCGFIRCGIELLDSFSLFYPIFPLFLPLLGWSGGAMTLGKLPILGRPTNSDTRTRLFCARSRCEWGCLNIFILLSFSPGMAE